MKTRLVLFFSVGLLACGCQTMKAELPASRMESPEVLGNEGKRVGFQFGASATQDLTLTADASARPPTLNAPLIERSADASGALSYGAFDRIDLGIKTSAGSSPYVVSAKLQLIGEPSAVAKAGNFSLAVTAGVGLNVITRNGDQKGIFGPGGHNWKSQLTEKLGDFALIAGYRVSDSALLYFGGFAQNITLDGKIEHSLSDDGSSPAADYSVSYRGRQRGANVGTMLEFGTAPAYFVVEGVYSHLEFEDDLKNWFFAGSLGMGARF